MRLPQPTSVRSVSVAYIPALECKQMVRHRGNCTCKYVVCCFGFLPFRHLLCPAGVVGTINGHDTRLLARRNDARNSLAVRRENWFEVW